MGLGFSSYKRLVSVRIDEVFVERLDELAFELGVGRSVLVRAALCGLLYYLKKIGDEELEACVDVADSHPLREDILNVGVESVPYALDTVSNVRTSGSLGPVPVEGEVPLS